MVVAMMSGTSDPLFDDAVRFIKELFRDEHSGHDFYHSIRVHKNAIDIAEREGGDLYVIRLSALLHDCDDRKLFDSQDFDNARRFMTSAGISSDIQETVCHIISQISFKGKDTVVPDSLEGKIVQDADRLDAIGAVGIARTFAFGGSRGRMMYDPDEIYRKDLSAEEYYASTGSTVSHFYEKLLLLKDMMNTDTAKEMARERHEFMISFLDEFYRECGRQ